MSNRTRPKQLIIRVSEKELEKIKVNVSKSKLSQNEYFLRSVLNKKIVVIDGIKELTLELKRIGNNLNQLTKAVHEGKANCARELAEVNEEMKEVWQSLRLLTQKLV